MAPGIRLWYPFCGVLFPRRFRTALAVFGLERSADVHEADRRAS